MSDRHWHATVVGIHAVTAIIIGLATASVFVDGVDHIHRNTAVAALAAWAIGYALLGAVAITGRSERPAVGYLALLVGVMGVVGWSDPGLLFLLVVAYPHVWFVVEHPRAGTVWTVLLAASCTTGVAIGVVGDGGSALEPVADMSVGLLFSVTLGFWMSRVLDQSRQRAALIVELESTRAALAAAHHEQGVTSERERLAREVHDTLAQGWTSVVVLAQTARAELAGDPAAVAERLALIEEVGRDNLRETRAVVTAFSPPALDGSTLVEALERLASRHTRETGTPVAVDVSGFAPAVLRRDDEIVLLRAAQEALTNVRRHARADRASVALCHGGSDVVVEVTDDGVGFDPGGAGTGLLGLRQRVEQAGGAFAVESRPGGGTRVTARLPVAVP